MNRREKKRDIYVYHGTNQLNEQRKHVVNKIDGKTKSSVAVTTCNVSRPSGTIVAIT